MANEPWWKLDTTNRLKRTLCESVDWPAIYTELFGWEGEGTNLTCYNAVNHSGGTDKKPSMSVLDDNGAVYCNTCGAKASTFIGALEDATGESFENVCQTLYNKHVEPLISDEVIEHMHAALMKDKKLKQRVKDKMKLQDKELVMYQIGWSKRRNRLTIPIKNEFGYYADVRCYDVFKQHADGFKVVSWKKGFGGARLWPFTRKRRVVLVEGEKDCIAARMIGLPAQTITSGGLTFKDDVLRQYEGKDVIVVGDNDPTGIAGAKKRARKLAKVARSVKTVTLPVEEPKEDMWDWVFKYSGTADKFWELVDGTEDQTESLGRELLTEDEMAGEVQEALRDEDTGLVAKAVAIFDTFKRGGWFYRTLQGTYYATELRTIAVSRRDPDFLSFCINLSPLLNREIRLGKVIMSHLEAMSANAAVRASISNQFYYDREQSRLFVKADEQAQTIKELSPDGTKDVQNGNNEAKVLLTFADHALKGFTFEDKPDWKKSIKWVWHEVMRYMPMSDDHRLLTLSWFVASLFKHVTPDRPILRFLAPSASGKSHILRLLSHLAYGGEHVDGPNATVASLASVAVKRPFLLIDNIEMEHVMQREGLNDLFIALATNVAKEKRRVGTDTDTVVERPECVSATTGIEPFAKSEIVNRFLYMPVDRKTYGRPDYFDFDRFEEISRHRDSFMHGVCELARLQIDKMRTELQVVARRYAVEHSQYIRFPVYMALMELVGIHIASCVGMNYDEAVGNAMQFQQDQLTTYGVGGNPVVTWLETWWVRTQGQVGAESSYVPIVNDDRNEWIWFLSPTELFNELSSIARIVNRRIPWLNPQQLSYRIKDAEEALKATGWSIDKFRSGGYNQIKLTKHGSLPDFTAAGQNEMLLRSLKKPKKVKGRA